MTSSEKKKMENQLDFLYEETKRESSNIDDIEDIVVSPEVFGKVEGLTDHDSMLKQINYESKEVVENMASFYLEKYNLVTDNKHLKDRILFDSKNLGDINFIQEITKKAVIEQMKYIEMGEASPRLYETLYVGIREFKDNVKQSTQIMGSIESAYKEINRELEKLSIKDSNGNIIDVESDESDDEKIITTNVINDKLDQILKNRMEKDRANKKKLD